MVLLLKDQEKTRNMFDGELAEFLLQTEITEYEMYQIKEAGLPHDVNFTVIKGEIQDSNFSYNLLNKDTNEFKELQREFSEGAQLMNLTTADIRNLNIQFDRTDNCNVTFLLVLPWKHSTQDKSQDIEGDVSEEIDYKGNIGALAVTKVIVRDYCWIKKSHTVYKGG